MAAGQPETKSQPDLLLAREDALAPERAPGTAPGQILPPAPARFAHLTQTHREVGGEPGSAAIAGSPSNGSQAAALGQFQGQAHQSAPGRVLVPQIVGAIVQGPVPGRVEVRLDPPELGRIEITLDIADQTLRAVLSAERPATGELLRRHGEMLLAQLQDAGFDSVDLEFSRERSPGRNGNSQGTFSPASGAAASADGHGDDRDIQPDGGPGRLVGRAGAGGAGLDLRL